jgi:predicted PurR-regulated permease PerM
MRTVHPALAPAVEWLNERIDIPEMLRTGSGAIAAWGGSVLRGSLEGMVNLLLTFYFLFYLLRDRETALTATADISPLTRDEFDLLATRVAGTIHATVYGTVAVAALQGLLGGLMFWWLGLPAPVLWGVLMGALAVIPFLGAFVIWAPVAVYLALSGSYASAILLAAWGTVVVGLVDNIVFPMLVGWRMMMHTVLSFIAIAGGLFVFGTPGVILGPVVTTTSLVLLGLWRQRNINERKNP